MRRNPLTTAITQALYLPRQEELYVLHVDEQKKDFFDPTHNTNYPYYVLRKD